MHDKTCMVTGATAGIGLTTAYALAQMGARVILLGRNPEKSTGVVERIRQETGNTKVDCLLADLSDQAQIRRLALQFQESYPRLDVLVNNAGGVFLWRQESADSLEMTFALNHLSYFLLTLLLLDILRDSAPARIVNVASNSHYGQKLDFDDLQMARGYRARQAYGLSKLANMLFTFELARRLQGTGVTVNALHPGYVATDIGLNNGWPVRLFKLLMRFRAITPEQGCRTSVYLATSPEVEGVSGEYFFECTPVRADPAAYDREAARRLWEISEELTGYRED